MDTGSAISILVPGWGRDDGYGCGYGHGYGHGHGHG